MCRLLRYAVSHCLYAAMLRVQLVAGQVKVRAAARCFAGSATLPVLVAAGLWLYVQWERSSDSSAAAAAVSVAVVVFVFVLGIASIFYYYFNMAGLGLSLCHFCYGCLLGLLSFSHSPSPRPDAMVWTASVLLVASVVLHGLWALVERLGGWTRHRPGFLTAAEGLQLAGFAVAGGAALVGRSACAAASWVVIVAALAALLVNLRTKAFLALASAAFFPSVCAAVFFPSLEVPVNPFAVACFSGRLVCEPLLDTYFSGLSATERWRPLLLCGGLWRKLSLLPVVFVEIAQLVLSALILGDLVLWIVPGFCVLGMFWIACHMIFIVTLWGFYTKLSDCQRMCLSQRSEVNNLDRVMASKGMRHFCLISQRLVLFTVLSTIVLGAFSWQPASSLFISVFLLVLHLESLAHGLFCELGTCLGGTAVGYAVVVPTNYCSPDGQPTLLPPDQVQELNLRSTAMLNNVQRFFSYHMIEAYGCDYSTSGMSLEGLQSKLRFFLDYRTSDGPRHDTYMLFYSGHTDHNGDWALAGGNTLQLDDIVGFWREKNMGFCSRLILILDTENSLPWVKEVRMVEGNFVAVQGAMLSHTTDVELQDAPQLGDFTAKWVEFNCNPDNGIKWSERGQTLSAIYGLSKTWGDYELHLPTGSDVAKHWRITYPVVQVANWAGGLNLWWACSLFLRCLRRMKLNWFPPAVLDIGQGIKLVKS
ncbi:transmembrane protein 168 [Denticeps clupeoides]|uniref:Uncharacterized protein n=1 Tax=Denticeps clupeoides TaxID=299321 RepID=A0AAY4DYS2_9TELE|nr:transmembrane protein 168-like [Denticeps clupeoides]